MIVQTGLRILIVVGLLLSGSVRHAFCDCGCAASAQEPSAAPACPHCQSGDKEDSSAPVEQCKCRPCQVVDAVPAVPPVEAPSPQRVAISFPLSLNNLALATANSSWENTSGLDPPGASRLQSCGLPILLEHLLF
ncbi:MAG: hypothetical protein V3V75_03740 [Thermoguttaceae bacterium]